MIREQVDDRKEAGSSRSKQGRKEEEKKVGKLGIYAEKVIALFVNNSNASAYILPT